MLKKSLKQPFKKIDPFHLICTPVPVFFERGIKTEIGLSSVDPNGSSKKSMDLDVWITVFSTLGERLKRYKIDHLPYGTRKFYCLNEILEDLNIKGDHLCAVHRIPSDLEILSDDTAWVPETHPAHFPMYRTVVQLAHKKGPKGSVIYEVHPPFNPSGNKSSSLLMFSNKVALSHNQTTWLVLVHYSTSPSYNRKAKYHLCLINSAGTILNTLSAQVEPYGIANIDIKNLLTPEDLSDSIQNYSLVCTSKDASMLPLLINIHAKNGGISIEHTHPPHSYLNMNPEDFRRVREKAINYFNEARK